MFIRSAYNYDRRQASLDSGFACEGESMTQQQFKEETDINELVRRFGLGYAMPRDLRMPQYGDFTGVESFHDACNAIAQANETFELLPALVRDRFSNDPGRFVEFMLDEKNADEAEKLGLVQRKAAPVSAVPVAVAEAAAKAVNSTPVASGSPPAA